MQDSHEVTLGWNAIVKEWKCCMYMPEHGTLVLGSEKRENRIVPTFSSLSVLKEVNSGFWAEIPLIDYSCTGFEDEEVKRRRATLRRSRALKKIALQSSFANFSNNPEMSHEAQLLGFINESRTIFNTVLRTLDQARNKEVPVQTMTSEWRSMKLLLDELQLLETTYGPTVFNDLSEDMRLLILSHHDDAGRCHELRIQLSTSFEGQESILGILADLPEDFPSNDFRKAKRTKPMIDSCRNEETQERLGKMGLLQLYEQFRTVVGQYQSAWNELDDLHQHCRIPQSPPPQKRSDLSCTIQLSDSQTMSFEVVKFTARKKPEKVQFYGKNVDVLKRRWNEAVAWDESSSVRRNLEQFLNLSLQREPAKEAVASPCEVAKAECGICYTAELEHDDKQQSEFPSIVCEKQHCARSYHKSCLLDWLETLSSSRIVFDVILGSCPYCNNPISASTAGARSLFE